MLYLATLHPTNAAGKVSSRFRASALPVVVDDPREVPSQPLSWYAQQVASAEAILCHFDNPERDGAELRNATVAFVAGLGHGLGKSVLLLGEGNYLAPLDYRERLKLYRTAAAAHDAVDAWLAPIEDAWNQERAGKIEASRAKRLHTQLKELQVGEYIAENEAEGLIDGYFLEAAAYYEALKGRKQSVLFVGRKGAGKSANYLKLASRLSQDVRNVVCEIKPPSYELTALLDLLERYVERDQKQFVINGLWVFLLYSEIASGLVRRIREKPVQAWSVDEVRLMEVHRANKELFEGDFASRLDRCIERLSAQAPAEEESLPSFRKRLSHALYQEIIGRVRSAVIDVAPKRGRICVLVDNLDKAWDRQSNLGTLAEFLLGLLTACNKLGNELSSALEENKTQVSLSVFLRSDIFDRIRSVAREPDKIEHFRLEWDDPELLLRLLDERLESCSGDGAPDALWSRFFCSRVNGVPVRDYLVQVTLPRPRDVIYLLKYAIATAVNRRHGRVEEEDLVKAEEKYSEFAFDVLRIEESSYEQPIADALIEFAGAPAVLGETDVVATVRKGLGREPPSDAVSRLCLLSFLSVEVGDGLFETVGDERHLEKAMVLAKRLAVARKSEVHYRIHRAYQTYLAVAV